MAKSKKSKEERDFEAQLAEFLPGAVQRPALPADRIAPSARQVAPVQPSPTVAPSNAVAMDHKLASLAAQVTNWQARHTELAAQFSALQAQAEELRGQLTRAQQHSLNLDTERRSAARKLTECHQDIKKLHDAVAAHDKTQLLQDRGLTRDEPLRALVLLLRFYGQRAVLALLAADPTALQELVDRLVLSCNVGPCERDDAPLLEVARDRCELCGGSDVQAAFGQLLEALRQRNVVRLTVVGGTPLYREILRKLNREHGKGLQLDTVGELVPNADQRARATTGLVLIWGATAVDHAVTNHWRDKGQLQITVAHRGIAGMLRIAAGRLATLPSK